MGGASTIRGWRALITCALVCATLLAAAQQSRAAHVSCGQAIMADTVLDSDLDCRFVAAPGLTIGAPAITLDLGGHTFLGQIRNDGFDDVRIVNGVIGDDLTLEGVHRNELRDITVQDGFVRVNHSGDNLLAGLSGTGPFSGVAEVNLPGSTGTTVADGRWLSVTSSSGNRVEGLRDSHVSGFSDNVITGNERGTVFVRGDRNQITDNKVDLVFVFEGDANAITDNSFSTDDVAISVQFSASNVIERNLISSDTVADQSAIFLFQTSSTLIADNEISGPSGTEGSESNRPPGIALSGSGNRVSGNSISGRARGIQLTVADGNAIVRNRVSDVGTSGIFLYLSDTNEVLRNRVSGAGEHGIELTSFSDDNRVERNTAVQSGLDGISILAGRGTGNLLSRNFVRFNRDDGIGVDQAGNTVSRNHAVRNFDWGIEAVDGTSDGGGNRASANGQRAQCLNVTCRR